MWCDEAVLNLPGMTNYDPQRRWVYKYHSVTHTKDFFNEIYIGYLRTFGPTEEAACNTFHFIDSIINYLGQQNMPRKPGYMI